MSLISQIDKPIADWLRGLDCRVTTGEDAQWEPYGPDCQIIDDEKNGWFQLGAGGDRPLYTVVQWTTSGGDHLFCTVFDNGELRDYVPRFWSYSGGTWKMREGVLPEIRLRDFWDEAKVPAAARSTRVFLENVLPRKGTTIQVRLVGPFDSATVRESTYKALDLVWDKRSGKFSKGKRVD